METLMQFVFFGVDTSTGNKDSHSISASDYFSAKNILSEMFPFFKPTGCSY